MFQVSHLSKSYRSHLVLSDISFEARPGDCIGLIGPNGCGKSTLLSVLSGMQKPDRGDILWEGQSLLRRPSLFRKLIGYVPQTNPLFEDMTAADHLRLWYSASSRSLEEDLKDGFPARLGIPQFLHSRVCDLSGCIKKRLSLACALACQPPLIFMDEPAAALDLICKEEIRGYIRCLSGLGKTILLVTHEEADFSLCTRLLLFTPSGPEEISPAAPPHEILQHLEKIPDH